jgi:hypothetical protein
MLTVLKPHSRRMGFWNGHIRTPTYSDKMQWIRSNSPKFVTAVGIPFNMIVLSFMGFKFCKGHKIKILC